MKRVSLIIVALVAVLMITPPALAVNSEQNTLDLQPLLLEMPEEKPANSMLTDVSEWKDRYTCYGDLLSAQEREIYDLLVIVFSAFAANMSTYMEDGRLSLKNIAFSDGQGGEYLAACWYIDNVIQLEWQFEEWVIDGEYFHTLQETFSAQFNAVDAMIKRAGAAVALDHPEFFWIRESCSVNVETSNPDKVVISDIPASGTGSEEDPFVLNMSVAFDAVFVSFPSSDSVGECEALQTEINSVLNSLLDTLEQMDASLVKKLEYAENWLAANNAYNNAAAIGGSLSVDETPWSIVSGLLESYSPVCEGYAKSFQLLCHNLGVPCLQVTGSANGAHMWNMVQLEGVWYFCDPTWDDPNIIDGETGTTTSSTESRKEYFLVAQPISHQPENTWALPELSKNGYFTWTVSGDGFTGSEIGEGRMLIILFGEGNKMLAVDFCERTAWEGEEYIHTPPAFDTTLLNRAAKIVRINVEEDGWIPLAGIKNIK